MEHVTALAETEDEAERRKRLRFLRSAAEDAVHELYRGELSLRDSEALARDITVVRGQIAALERSLCEAPERAAKRSTEAASAQRG